MVLAAAAGDRDAFCCLYGLYKDKMYRYAFYRLGNPDDAEDAVSDCVISAFEQIGRLKKADAFSYWIFRILYCSCNAQIKSQINRCQTDDIESLSDKISTNIDTAVERTELQQALDILSDGEKEIVLLSVVSGFNSKEIARITDMTPGSVRSKLSRSLKKMRKFLE